MFAEFLAVLAQRGGAKDTCSGSKGMRRGALARPVLTESTEERAAWILNVSPRTQKGKY